VLLNWILQGVTRGTECDNNVDTIEHNRRDRVLIYIGYCRVIQRGNSVLINWILQSVTGGRECDNKLDIVSVTGKRECDNKLDSVDCYKGDRG
jgi:hypothetical protein